MKAMKTVLLALHGVLFALVVRAHGHADPGGPEDRFHGRPCEAQPGTDGLPTLASCAERGADELHPVTDVIVVADARKDLALCPKGTSRLDGDLNEGAGGDFVHLCISRDPGSRPLTRLDAVVSNGPTKRGTAGWELIPGDLNQGAGGSVINLRVKRERLRPPVRDLLILSHKRFGNHCPSFWRWIRMDLNEGVRANASPYVFICYR